MDFDNKTNNNKLEDGCSIEVLFRDHHIALFSACLVSLILGFPLAWNILWHLRTATTARGRGVLRLLLIQQQINLLCVPALCFQLFIIICPSESMPLLLCLFLQVLFVIVQTNRGVSHLTIALERLYYLYEDSMIKHMKEESFFMCLKWFHHSLTGIIASTMLVESRLDTNESHSLHIFYSFCSKKHILWEEFQGSSANKMFAVTQMTLMALTFISQIFLFIREKQLEKQRREGIMVVTYNMDGVTISRRGPNIGLNGKLWRHNRTAVTPKASLFSFLVSLMSHLLRLYFILSICPSGLPIFGQFIFCLHFCYLFLIDSLIETIFSPKLYKSLSDFFLRSNRSYRVTDV